MRWGTINYLLLLREISRSIRATQSLLETPRSSSIIEDPLCDGPAVEGTADLKVIGDVESPFGLDLVWWLYHPVSVDTCRTQIAWTLLKAHNFRKTFFEGRGGGAGAGGGTKRPFTKNQSDWRMLITFHAKPNTFDTSLIKKQWRMGLNSEVDL